MNTAWIVQILVSTHPMAVHVQRAGYLSRWNDRQAQYRQQRWNTGQDEDYTSTEEEDPVLLFSKDAVLHWSKSILPVWIIE